MLYQRLSYPLGCRRHNRPAAQHYAHKRLLLVRGPIVSATSSSNQQPGSNTLSQQDRVVQEDCQWLEPLTVSDSHHLLEAISSNGAGNSDDGSEACLQPQQCAGSLAGNPHNVAQKLPVSSSRSSSTNIASFEKEGASSSSSEYDSGSCWQPNEHTQQEQHEQQEHEQQELDRQQQQQQEQQQQQPPWPPDVPWGLSKAVQVMGLWLLAYFATGQLLVPAALAVFDLDQTQLSARGSAVLNLALDILQVGITVGILAHCLKKYEPLKRKLFPISWQRGQWLGPVAAGATVFPVVDWLVHTGHSWSQAGLEVVQAPPDMWTAQIEAGLYSQDWLSCLAYILVVVVFAPIWEEAIFRGFLLRTLMKPFAPHTAVLGSALMFALCHFNQDTFAPLVLLGVVFGWLYAKCDNLLPPMVLHSLWNSYVLGTLVLRMHTGCDAVTCSILMAVGTQVVLLLCGLILMKVQQHSQPNQQQTAFNS